MLHFLLIVIGVLLFDTASGQQRLYPVHVNQKWGLMDVEGGLVVKPIYNNIGLFEKEGYAIVEEDGLLGVVDTLGTIVIPCKYALMDYIGRGLFSVKVGEVWQVINIKDKLILDKMAGKIRFLEGNYLSYEELTGLGLAHIDRGVLLPPQFKSFNFLEGGYIVGIDEKEVQTIHDSSGQSIIAHGFSKIKIKNNWIWGKRNGKWGSYTLDGQVKLHHNWSFYESKGVNFYELIDEDERHFLYSRFLDTIILRKVPKLEAFDVNRVEFVRRDGSRGLVDRRGNILFEGAYEFITKFSPTTFRVKKEDHQGVIRADGSVLIPFIYNYIGNLDDQVAIVRKKEQYGVINQQGKLVLPPVFQTSPELRDNHVRYKDPNGALQLFDFDEKGELIKNTTFSNLKSLKIRISNRGANLAVNNTPRNTTNPYQISDSLCWLFHSGSRMWGLWNLQTKKYKFAPQWSSVVVLKQQGLSIVGQSDLDIGGRLNTGRIKLRVNEVFGLFNNKHGLPISKMEFIDIRMSDFQTLGLDIARCIFVGGSHGLLKSNGRVLARGYVYIGEFIEGKARATKKGRLVVDLDRKIKRPIGKASTYYNSLRASYSFDNDDDPKFFRALNTHGQLYCVDAKWGYIDSLGGKNSGFKYDYVENYSNDRALIRQDGKWGMLDHEGNEVLAPAYDNFNFLPNANKKLFFITRNQQLYGAIDSNAKIIVPVKYTRIRTYKEDRIAVKNQAGRWGYVDRNSNEIIKTKYRVAYDFSEGLAVIFDQSRWGALDQNGNVVIKPQYLKMGSFVEGKAWVHLARGKKGYINQKGKLLFSGKYSKLTDFKDGIARVFVRKKGWGLMDTTGHLILKPKRHFKKIEPFNNYGLAKVKIGKKYRLINREGKFVGKRAYGAIKEFNEGLAIVRLQALSGFHFGRPNLKWTFIDTTGELVTKNEFRQLQAFSEGRAAFTNEDSKRGYINKEGAVIIEPVYFRVEEFKENRAVVWDNYNRTGVIDTTGKVIIPIEYNKILDINQGLALVRKNSWTYYFVREDTKRHTPNNFSGAHIFEGNVTPVKSNNKWGVINEKGLQMLIPKYAKITPFEEGVAKVSVTDLIGVVDVNGKVIIEPEYEYIAYVGKGLFRVERGDKMGYLNMDGEWVWSMK
ncbi:WG repeat-containing protein [Aureispira anguillae]|uniref:WG repeat-containing protein n=1 Tax=Aureispira anguillae TaxID=2864201 RepID=A0A915YCY5_9BACT|nr:WG repeat-containing protein [Aureispira anguillae]BDS10805.1 WG repeat-containing protein [Aureispira anguillae]